MNSEQGSFSVIVADVEGLHRNLTTLNSRPEEARSKGYFVAGSLLKPSRKPPPSDLFRGMRLTANVDTTANPAHYSIRLQARYRDLDEIDWSKTDIFNLTDHLREAGRTFIIARQNHDGRYVVSFEDGSHSYTVLPIAAGLNLEDEEVFEISIIGDNGKPLPINENIDQIRERAETWRSNLECVLGWAINRKEKTESGILQIGPYPPHSPSFI